jgi:aspartate/methionine/tyrosine aminotransferase
MFLATVLNRRRYVGNFRFHKQVERMVSRAALSQRFSLCGFRASWLVAGARINKAAMNNPVDARILPPATSEDHAHAVAANRGNAQPFETLDRLLVTQNSQERKGL